MSDIIDLKAVRESIGNVQDEPQVWVCGCGCRTFELWSDHTERCALCAAIVTGHEGGWYKLTESDARWEGGSPAVNVNVNNCVHFVRHQLAEKSLDDNICAIVLVDDDARISTWTNITSPHQMKWLLGLLEEAAGDFTRRMQGVAASE